MKSGFLPEKNKGIVPKSVIFIQMKISSLNVNPLKFNSIESHNILENSILTNYGFRLDSRCIQVEPLRDLARDSGQRKLTYSLQNHCASSRSVYLRQRLDSPFVHRLVFIDTFYEFAGFNRFLFIF